MNRLLLTAFAGMMLVVPLTTLRDLAHPSRPELEALRQQPQLQVAPRQNDEKMSDDATDASQSSFRCVESQLQLSGCAMADPIKINAQPQSRDRVRGRRRLLRCGNPQIVTGCL